MFHDVESLTDDFAVLFDFWKEGETTEELLTAAARKMQKNKHLRKTVITLANSSINTIDAFR